MLSLFEKKIKNKTAKIGVIGLGYVGLPLALAFGKKGFSVTGFEVDAKKISSLQKGRSYVLDILSKDIKDLTRKKRFRATGDSRELYEMDAVIICVPTPLAVEKRRDIAAPPDLSHIENAAKDISQHLRRGQLVILESTTYPGTTEEVVLPILQKSKWRVEHDFFLAFSPERVDPGNKQFDTTSIPKVVGAVGPDSLKAAGLLYGSVMKKIVQVSSAKVAEMTKLLENTFRSVNIALINEMAMLSNQLGVDIWDVIEAAKTKPFGFMPFYPGPGTGGHCLPIDPLYLTWQSRQKGYQKKMMIEFASLEINRKMPGYVVSRVREMLYQRKKKLKNASILVLGVSYKKDVEDVRESPAVEVVDHLIKGGAVVSYADPHVPKFKTASRQLSARALSPKLLKKQALVLLLTNHSLFNEKMIVKNSKLILDTRNALRKFYDPKKGNLFFL